MKQYALLLLCGAAACANEPARAIPRSSKEVRSTALVASTSAAELDGVIDMVWRDASVTPATAATDLEFLRRATIDLVGRIPSAAEVHEVLDAAPTKVQIVDRLLASEGWAEHWAEVHLDWYVPVETQYHPHYRTAPKAWLKDSLNQGKPYDALVQEILTASGRLDVNGATAFLASQLHDGSVERAAAATLDVFLDFEEYKCAQCHDHPSDSTIRQEDFFGVTAYLAGLELRWADGTRILELAEYPDRKLYRNIGGTDRAIVPRFLGATEREQSEIGKREALANAVLGSPRFAETIVRRMWMHFLGRPPVNASRPIGDWLAHQFASGGYDLKALMRSIVLSKAYDRSCRGGGSEASVSPEVVFARASIRPLSPRILYRALVQATSLDPSWPTYSPHRPTPEDTERVKRSYHEIFSATVPESTLQDTPMQALELLNGWLTNRGSLSLAGSRLESILASHDDPGRILDEIYVTVLGRPPANRDRERELGAIHDISEPQRKEAWEDVMYSMLISTEFLTNH